MRVGQVEGAKKENRKFRLQIGGFTLLSVLFDWPLNLGVFHSALNAIGAQKFLSALKMLIICINRASTMRANLSLHLVILFSFQILKK